LRLKNQENSLRCHKPAGFGLTIAILAVKLLKVFGFFAEKRVKK